MNQSLEDISSFWNNILKSDEKYSKNDARKELLRIGNRIYKLDGDIEIKYELSSIIFGMMNTLERTPDRNDDLKVTSIIVLERPNKVYYVYDKTLLKDFALTNPWFFKQFRKAEVIAENEFYMLLRDQYPSNLAYLAHIILNKDKEVIFEKSNQGEWIQLFLNSIKNI